MKVWGRLTGKMPRKDLIMQLKYKGHQLVEFLLAREDQPLLSLGLQLLDEPHVMDGNLLFLKVD